MSLTFCPINFYKFIYSFLTLSSYSESCIGATMFFVEGWCASKNKLIEKWTLSNRWLMYPLSSVTQMN